MNLEGCEGPCDWQGCKEEATEPLPGDLATASGVGGDAGALVEERGVVLLRPEAEGEAAAVRELEAAEDEEAGLPLRAPERHHPVHRLEPLILQPFSTRPLATALIPSLLALMRQPWSKLRLLETVEKSRGAKRMSGWTLSMHP